MAIDADVLVVGGGLAGATAALAAADTGAGVRLVSESTSTLRHASGLIDVLGYTPDGDGPLVDPFSALGDLPAGHPYERAGRPALEAGLALFDEVVGDAYEGSHTAANALVPTAGGFVKPTGRYPATVASGLASDSRDALLVGFDRLPAFDAPFAAATLAEADPPFAVRGVTVEFPAALGADPGVTRFARLLDGDEGDVRAALADRVAPNLGGAERVGFPAVLGEERAAAVTASLDAALDAAVFEVPMGPPSLPGIRLEAALFDALDAAGVRVETGVRVVDHAAAGDRVESVTVERSGTHVPYTASEYVLATGGLVGRGIETNRQRVREPVFDCHVPAPDDRYDWFAGDAFGDHPFARFGVQVDGRMRPLAADGGPEYGNLRAAGAVLGNYDFAAEKSGSGVSLATGYRAGRLAGGVA